MAILKIVILTGESLVKTLLAILLVLDMKLSMIGMSILLIMWLPAFILVVDTMMIMHAQQNKMSAAQIILVIILFPFLPTFTHLHSLYNWPLPTQIQSKLTMLMTFPVIVSSPIQMALLIWCFFTGDIKIDGELIRYYHVYTIFIIRIIIYVCSYCFHLLHPLLLLHHHLCLQHHELYKPKLSPSPCL